MAANLVGFDLNEVGVSQDEWDENVGARCLFKLCNMLVTANPLVTATEEKADVLIQSQS